jgi:hypothetical protein
MGGIEEKTFAVDAGMGVSSEGGNETELMSSSIDMVDGGMCERKSSGIQRRDLRPLTTARGKGEWEVSVP